MARSESNTIIRTNKRENPYVMIDKYGLNDDRLSWKAKGLLAYLLSKPDDWQIYEKDLIKRSTDGRDAVRAGLRELEANGYLSRHQLRGEGGSFGTMEYIIYERPITETTVDGKSVHGESPQTENPSTGKPSPENPTHTNNELTKNDLKRIDCLGVSAEIAATAESSHSEDELDPIYESLHKNVPASCFVNGLPLGPEYINAIYFMLINQFDGRLDPAVIEIACGLYFDRACQGNLDGSVRMKLDVQNPVGYFRFCYEDAIKQYKLKRRALK
ncbi:helix-turn-helix domain-containing protein [Paenibacillus humicola]|uniref:helix-turn-helix domain-containing protein n=1 Tax=Paenibacillus humicola TaxID=3110540 RepID=UPI00237B1A71|nr:helix-turn-helix domain-containing protein [Paenibacillus humicola]